jgi:hypothetical protein
MTTKLNSLSLRRIFESIMVICHYVQFAMHYGHFFLCFIETLLREEYRSCGSLVVGAGIVEPCDETLSWDSWDRTAHCDNRTSPRPPRSRHQRRSVPSSEDEPLVPHVPASSHLFAGPLSPVPLLHHTPPTTPTIRGRGRKKVIKQKAAF